jgi:hypothetical protein
MGQKMPEGEDPPSGGEVDTAAFTALLQQVTTKIENLVPGPTFSCFSRILRGRFVQKYIFKINSQGNKVATNLRVPLDLEQILLLKKK